jgi:hypothetical protein
MKCLKLFMEIVSWLNVFKLFERLRMKYEGFKYDPKSRQLSLLEIVQQLLTVLNWRPETVKWS